MKLLANCSGDSAAMFLIASAYKGGCESHSCMMVVVMMGGGCDEGDHCGLWW